MCLFCTKYHSSIPCESAKTWLGCNKRSPQFLWKFVLVTSEGLEELWRPFFKQTAECNLSLPSAGPAQKNVPQSEKTRVTAAGSFISLGRQQRKTMLKKRSLITNTFLPWQGKLGNFFSWLIRNNQHLKEDLHLIDQLLFGSDSHVGET